MKIFNRKSTVGGDAVILTVSKIAVSLIGLITSMLLARFRTLDEYGTYSQIIMVVDLVSTILLLGLPNSINFFLAKVEDDEQKQKFLSVYLTLSTILTVIISACMYLAMPLIINYFNNPAITAFAYVFAIYPWSSLMINSLSNTCVVYGKADRLIWFNIIQAATTLVILLGAKLLDLSFRQYMYIYIASLFLFAVFGVIFIRKMSGALKVLIDISLIKEIFVISIPMGLASVVGTLNAELDKLVIGRFFTTEEYAIFANAAKELPVTMLATSLTAVLLPCLVRLLREKKTEEASKLWGYAANISFCVMCLIVGGFFVFAPDIMSLFYSEKYVTDEGIAVFRIYSLILLFRAIYWGIILNATGKTKFVFYSSILTLLMNLIGNIISCYAMGFIGPAISSLVVTGVMAFVQLQFTSKIIGIRISKLLPWKNIGTVIIETVIIAAVFWLVKYSFLDSFDRTISIIISIGLGAVWAVIYLVLNFKFIINNWKSLNSQRT